MHDLDGKWCLVTGASSGIGAEFSRQLAVKGARLILVARREERLRELADELSSSHQTESRVIAADLVAADACQQLFDQTADLEVDLLVNNAGFGHYGAFAEMESDRAAQMVDLNIGSLVQLTHLFVRPMLERRRGGVINVASTSSFQAIPFMSLYAATKAFVLHFSEGLWAETRKQGVTVHALCPGFTKTEFFDEAKLPESVPFGTTTVQHVVSDALTALAKKKPFRIPGWMNYFLTLSNRFVTRRMGTSNIGRMFHPKRHRSKASGD